MLLADEDVRFHGEQFPPSQLPACQAVLLRGDPLPLGNQLFPGILTVRLNSQRKQMIGIGGG